MPVFLLHGDNTLDIDESAARARKSFDDADTIVLDGTTAPVPSMVEACQTSGLFATDRLVILHGLHQRFKGARKLPPETDDIKAMLKQVAPTTTLLLISKGMPPDNWLASAVREAGGKVDRRAVPRKQELPGWVLTRARSEGVEVHRPAAELLVELAGAEPLLLQNELTKLITNAGKEQAVTVEMVEELVGAVPQETIFALVDAIASGNRAVSLQLLHGELERASTKTIDFALYLVRMLARQMRILLRIQLGQEAGTTRGRLIDELKLPPYYADRYFKQAKGLKRTTLIASFERLAGFDHDLKMGRVDAAAGLDLLVAELCG